MHRMFSAALAAIAIATAVPAVAQAQAKPVTIQQCFITAPKGLSKKAGGTQIDWTNVSHRQLHNVTFAVAYRNASHNFLRRVTDSGSFAPGTPIIHHFSLYSDIIYGGKTAQCTVVASH